MSTNDTHSAPDRYAVFGYPIQHSLSPFIHDRFARATGQHLTYEKIEVRPEGFAAAVTEFFASGGKGLNITVPHKQAAFALLATATPRAKLAASVNTLKRDADGLWGDNTDGAGLIADLTGNLRLTLQGARILLIGAGGAAHGVVGPLLQANPSLLEITNRNAARAVHLAEHFAAQIPGGPVRGCAIEAISPGAFDLVINATSASLQGEFPALSAQTIGPATFATTWRTATAIRPSLAGPKPTEQRTPRPEWECWSSKPPRRSICGAAFGPRPHRCSTRWPSARRRRNHPDQGPLIYRGSPTPARVVPCALTNCA